jgi:hypothetical protein
MNLPEIGTQWTNGLLTVRVVGADKRGVKIVSDSGYQVIAPYAWPGLFVPVMAETEPQGMLRACLIGGAEGRHFERILDIAADRGIDIAMHTPGDKGFGGIPDHTDLVITLASHLSHGVYDLTKAVCKARSIPLALVVSQGFGGSLDKELERLGIPNKMKKDNFGAVEEGSSRMTWTTWNGRVWVTTEREREPEKTSDLLLVGAAATTFGLLGLWLSRRKR